MIQSKIKEIEEKPKWPALFCSDDRGIVIVGIEDMGGDVFAGMVVHPESKFGQYSVTWNQKKFRRMPSGSEFSLKFIQE